MKNNNSPWLLNVIKINLDSFFLIGLLTYLAFFDQNLSSNMARGEAVYQVIFIDFFAYLITFYIFGNFLNNLSTKKESSKKDLGNKVLFILLLALGGYFLWGMLSPLMVLVWGISLLKNYFNIKEIYYSSIFRFTLILVSGFIVAIIGSMAGVGEEELLTKNLPTAYGWGILYYVLLIYFNSPSKVKKMTD